MKKILMINTLPLSSLLKVSTLWVFVIFYSNCVKYKRLATLSKPTYLRVFNDLSIPYSPLTKDEPIPFLVFLFDPVFDSKNLPIGGAYVGDFLQSRTPYNPSYPITEANVGVVKNQEFPGSLSLPAAPVINGFDLSSWAQMPSGKHRILFLTRPLTDTAFANLPAFARNNKIVDTMVDLSPGEVYTMEVINYDQKNNRAGIYLRKETFPHQNFENNKIYFNIYNLTTSSPDPAIGTLYPFTIDTLNAYYTYNATHCFNLSSDPTNPSFDCPSYSLPGYDSTYFFTLTQKYASSAPYISIPFLYQFDNIQYPDSTFKVAKDRPSLLFTFFLPNSPILLDSIRFQDGTPLPFFAAESSISGVLTPQSTVNTIELVNDQVYYMQIQRLYVPPAPGK